MKTPNSRLRPQQVLSLSMNDPFDLGLDEDDELLEEDPFGDCFAEEPEAEAAEETEVDEQGNVVKKEFRLRCPHGREIERKRVFGFIDFQHKDDNSSCDLLNKFNLKSARVSELLADGSPRSIRDDAYRAHLLTSPKKRKEYFEFVGKMPLYEFLAEIKLLDRYVVLRHGPDSSPYKLGVEVFKAFGKEICPAVDYLFPNDEYMPKSVQRTQKYFRNLPAHQPAKIPVKCFSELEVMLQVRRDNEDMIRRAEIGQVPNNPTGIPTPGAAPFAPMTPNPGGQVMAPGGGTVWTNGTTTTPSVQPNSNQGPFAPVNTGPLGNNHPAIGGTPYFHPHSNNNP